MTDEEWKGIVRLMQALWPSQASKLTTELLGAYRNHMINRGYEEVERTLYSHLANSNFFPKIHEIRSAIARLSPPPTLINSRDHEDIELSEKSWERTDELFRELSADERERHRRSEISANWTMETHKDREIDDKCWRSVIVCRICKGIGPDAIESFMPVPQRPPAEQHKPMKELFREIQ
jgi:hypothetical protein